MAITLSTVTAGTKALASKANEILAKMEEIRVKHANGGGFSSTPAAFNTTYNTAGTTIPLAYVTLVKTYMQRLETSKYIAASYSTQLPTVAVGDYIKAVDQYNKYVSLINSIDALCVYDNYKNHKSNNANYSAFDDYWNYNACE